MVPQYDSQDHPAFGNRKGDIRLSATNLDLVRHRLRMDLTCCYNCLREARKGVQMAAHLTWDFNNVDK